MRKNIVRILPREEIFKHIFPDEKIQIRPRKLLRKMAAGEIGIARSPRPHFEIAHFRP